MENFPIDRKFFTFCKYSNSSDLIGKKSTFSTRSEKNFRKCWESGKFSDLSEKFPQMQIFQLIEFLIKNGKFSTFCKCSNTSDFIGKISTFSIKSENWHTYRPGWIKFPNFRKSWKSGKLSDLLENFPLLQISQLIKFWKKILRFSQIGKFSTFSIRAETSHISWPG